MPGSSFRRLRVQLVRYGFVGILNTLIGFSIIAAMTFAGAGAYLANATGYGTGLLASYVLNKYFTFEAGAARRDLMQFAAAFAVAYGFNLAMLTLALPLAGHHPLVPQLLAAVVYSIVFFVLMKLWVFRRGA